MPTKLVFARLMGLFVCTLSAHKHQTTTHLLPWHRTKRCERLCITSSYGSLFQPRKSVIKENLQWPIWHVQQKWMCLGSVSPRLTWEKQLVLSFTSLHKGFPCIDLGLALFWSEWENSCFPWQRASGPITSHSCHSETSCVIRLGLESTLNPPTFLHDQNHDSWPMCEQHTK